MGFITDDPAAPARIQQQFYPVPANHPTDLPGQDEVGMGYGSLAPGAATQPANPLGSFTTVENLLGSHANMLRQRLMAAHLNGGLAPVEQPTMPNFAQLQKHFHQLPARTASPNFSNLQALIQRALGLPGARYY